MMDCTDVKNFKPGAVHYPPNQDAPLNFNPMTGASFPAVELHRASDYRTGMWRYNPWIGTKRHSQDVNNDPFGMHILPPSEYLMPTDGKPAYTIGVDVAREGADRTAIVTPPAEVNSCPEPTSPLGKQVGGDHYKGRKIQPVEYIHANGIGFVEGCVIKYVSRWREKNGPEDLRKARHFIDLLLQLENGK